MCVSDDPLSTSKLSFRNNTVMANRPNRFIKLSEAENEKLRALEQNPHVHAKYV